MWLFLLNPHKVETVITSLTEMLELLNFDHMNTSIILFDLRDKISLVTSLTEVMMP